MTTTVTVAELAADPLTKVLVRFVKGRGHLATAAREEFLGHGEQPTEAAAKKEALEALASSIRTVTAARLRQKKLDLGGPDSSF